MKKSLYALLLLICGAIIAPACTPKPYPEGVPSDYYPLLDKALEGAQRREAITALLEECPRGERKALAHLLAWMPRADLDTMSLDLLIQNLHLACRARTEFVWCRDLPEEIFLGEVLPYYVVDEVRDEWRETLYRLVSPTVEGATTLREAAEAVNRAITSLTGVSYNTLREKTNQSPRESMRQGMASCTGLSILLVDALRAVGIPARFVGTASWHDNRGNHSWTEVWMEGRWWVTEYVFPGAFGDAWFMADAGKAIARERNYAIYATHFGEADDWFPMVWALEEESPNPDWSQAPQHIAAINVTESYQQAAALNEEERLQQGTHLWLGLEMWRDRHCDFQSGDRVEANVDLFTDEGVQVGGGRTAGSLRDLNDRLRILVEKGKNYEVRYTDGSGRAVVVPVEVGHEAQDVRLFWH